MISKFLASCKLNLHDYGQLFSYNSKDEIGQIAKLAQTKVFTFDDVYRLTGMTNGTASESYNSA